jgi:hypothetical protein
MNMSTLMRQSKQGADAPKSSYSEDDKKHQVEQVLHRITFAPGLEHSNESNDKQSNCNDGKNLQHDLPPNHYRSAGVSPAVASASRAR